jgi:DNA-binding transcriptional regulator GbsR (MarR family)
MAKDGNVAVPEERGGASDAEELRMRLVDVGGRMSQDLGFGRILGQVLMYLYLRERECSLGVIEEALGLSKAAVSIAARQLENLGLVTRVWKKGDRRSYYRTTENLGAALRQGLLGFVRQKIEAAGSEMDQVQAELRECMEDREESRELQFIERRLDRALVLRDRAERLMSSPLMRLLVR